METPSSSTMDSEWVRRNWCRPERPPRPSSASSLRAHPLPTTSDLSLVTRIPHLCEFLKLNLYQVNIPPKPLGGGGGGVNLALSWECLSNKNRAFYMQRLAKLMRKDLNMVYLVSIVFRCFADPNEKYKYFL